MEPPWDGGMKKCSTGPDYMTKMTAMPIYGKNTKKIFFYGTKRPVTLKLGMQHRVLQVSSNDDNELTLTYLVPYAFVWEKSKQWIFQKLL